MEHKMRRSDRQLTRQEAEEILSKGEYGVLSTADGEGIAYGVPISYAYVNGRLYFHGALEGRKLDNIKVNPHASFCVVGKTQVLPEKFSTNYESAIAEGKIYLVEGDEKLVGLTGLIEKYSPEFMEKGMKYINADKDKAAVYVLEIESLTGKARR